MTLTLNLIKSKRPCKEGYYQLLASLDKTEADDEPVSINHILESNGMEDTFWVIFNCIEGREMDKRNMLADIVESVEWIWKKEYPDSSVVRDVIEGLRDEGYGEWALDNLGDEAYNCCVDNYAADRIARVAYWASKVNDDSDWAASIAYDAIYDNALNEGKTIEEAIEAEKEEREKQKGIILKWFGV